MRYLLQFFLNHQCITQNLIFDWYNSKNAQRYVYFEEAKQLAKPFITLMLANYTIEGMIALRA
jgi:hypothetical protein